MPASPTSGRAALPAGAFVPPTGDDLVSALLAGDDAVERHRARFRVASAAESVQRLVVQAIDPLLLTVVLGPELAARWVPPLETYYTQARRASPATFLDFDRAWDLQRQRWRPLIDDAAAADDDVRRDPGPADSLEPSRGPDRAGVVPGGQAAGPRGARRGGRSAAPGERSGTPAPGARPHAPVPFAAPGPDSGGGEPVPVLDASSGEVDPLSGLALDAPVDPEAADRIEPDGDPEPPDLPPLGGEAAEASAPRAGRHGLAVAAAARRPEFDLVTVFDGCLSEVDAAEPHWEAFRFGAASLQGAGGRRR